MSCPNCKHLCNRLIISDSVTFTDDTLIIDIPAGSYVNDGKYCIVVAQSIPDTTTIVAPVAITIGGDTATTYPLVNNDCTAVSACQINTRTRYTTYVRTNVNDGVFQLAQRLPCSRCFSAAPALPIPDAPAEVNNSSNTTGG